jgi:hypothetical protein
MVARKNFWLGQEIISRKKAERNLKLACGLNLCGRITTHSRLLEHDVKTGDSSQRVNLSKPLEKIQWTLPNNVRRRRKREHKPEKNIFPKSVSRQEQVMTIKELFAPAGMRQERQPEKRSTRIAGAAAELHQPANLKCKDFFSSGGSIGSVPSLTQSCEKFDYSFTKQSAKRLQR